MGGRASELDLRVAPGVFLKVLIRPWITEVHAAGKSNDAIDNEVFAVVTAEDAGTFSPRCYGMVFTDDDSSIAHGSPLHGVCSGGADGVIDDPDGNALFCLAAECLGKGIADRI